MLAQISFELGRAGMEGKREIKEEGLMALRDPFKKFRVGDFFLAMEQVRQQIGMNVGRESRFPARKAWISSSNEHILTIPGIDRNIIPQLAAKRVVTGIFLLVKEFLPINRPLAIHVMLSGLMGRSRGKEYRVGMAGQGAD